MAKPLNNQCACCDHIMLNAQDVYFPLMMDMMACEVCCRHNNEEPTHHFRGDIKFDLVSLKKEDKMAPRSPTYKEARNIAYGVMLLIFMIVVCIVGTVVWMII
jgi:hypothetical protein